MKYHGSECSGNVMPKGRMCFGCSVWCCVLYTERRIKQSGCGENSPTSWVNTGTCEACLSAAVVAAKNIPTTVYHFLEKQSGLRLQYSIFIAWLQQGFFLSILKHLKTRWALIKSSFHSLTFHFLLWSNSLWQHLHHLKKCQINNAVIMFISWPHETRWKYLNLTCLLVLLLEISFNDSV